MTPRNFVYLYRWYDDYARTARWRGDETGQQLAQCYYQANRSNDGDQIKVHCDEGLKLAIVMNEPYWELYFRLRLHRISPEYGTATDDLIQMSIDINQPRYEGCPLAVEVYRELLNAYSATDPLGRADDILEGATYIEQNLALDQNTYLELQYYRARVYKVQKDWQQAYFSAETYMGCALEQVDTYHTLQATVHLTEILYRMGNYAYALATLEKCKIALARAHDPKWQKTILLCYLVLYKRVGDDQNYQKVKQQIIAMQDIHYYYLANFANLDEMNLSDDKSYMLSLMRRWLTGDSVISKYPYLHIEMYYEYLAQVDASSVFDRNLHYGMMIPGTGEFVRPQNLSLINLIVGFIRYLFVWIAGSIGLVNDTENRATLNELDAVINETSASQCYQERLLRMELGDYHLLS